MLTVRSLPTFEGHPAAMPLAALRHEVVTATEAAERDPRGEPYCEFVHTLYEVRMVRAELYLSGTKGPTGVQRDVLVDIGDSDGRTATSIHHHHCTRTGGDAVPMRVHDRHDVAIAAAGAHLGLWGERSWHWLLNRAEDAVQEHDCLQDDLLPAHAYPAMFAARLRPVDGAAAILDGESNPAYAASAAAVEAAAAVAKRLGAHGALSPGGV